MKKIPIKFEDYSHSLVQSGYQLTELDKFFIKGFRKLYKKSKAELDVYFTLVSTLSSGDLYKTLEEGTWLCTNIMYFWFEILGERCQDEYLFDPSVSVAQMRRNGSFTTAHSVIITLKPIVRNSSTNYLNEEFSNYGWADPYLWTTNAMSNIPHQDNGNGCGAFTLVFAKHCIFRRPTNFTQADIAYYRSKIVIFKRSWEKNAYKVDLKKLLSEL